MVREMGAAMLYRLFLEEVAKRQVTVNVLSEFIDGFTIVTADGYWQGQNEQSAVVELVLPDESDQFVNEIAQALAIAHDQTAILVERLENKNWFVGQVQ